MFGQSRNILVSRILGTTNQLGMRRLGHMANENFNLKRCLRKDLTSMNVEIWKPQDRDIWIE